MHLMVVVTSIDRDYLDYYQNITGLGSVRLGRKEHGNQRDCFVWDMKSCQAKIFLNIIYPYMKIKKAQADIALKFQDTMNKSWDKKRVHPDILFQRQRYKQELTRMKGYKTKRGRPRNDRPTA
jgi:hypothetical protein